MQVTVVTEDMEGIHIIVITWIWLRSGSSTGSGYGNGRRKNRRTPSNLINPSTITSWDPNAVTSQEQDMSAAMQWFHRIKIDYTMKHNF